MATAYRAGKLLAAYWDFRETGPRPHTGIPSNDLKLV